MAQKKLYAGFYPEDMRAAKAAKEAEKFSKKQKNKKEENLASPYDKIPGPPVRDAY